MNWVLAALGAAIGLLVIVTLWMKRRRAKDTGPISIVVLRRTPRGLTEADVRGAIRRALDVEAQLAPLDMPDGRTRGFIATADGLPPIAVIDSARTYCEPDERENEARGFEDERARDAYLAHAAWVSVDALGIDTLPPRDIRDKIYDQFLGKVAAQLIDDDSVLLYLACENRVGLITPETADLLAGQNVAAVFGDDSLQQPLIHVAPDDRAINAAMQMARDRLPELVQAWTTLGATSTALVKGAFTAADGETEYMWVKVTAATPAAITGTVANRPAHKDLPPEGAVVELPPERIADWMYIDKKQQPQGGFVERLLLAD
ncbi:MAG: DUF2314 domain-containing protein [Phycisphaerae bacterium]|nr:DUF2314 domain-containing protein [Phycisphaerae bacterium]